MQIKSLQKTLTHSQEISSYPKLPGAAESARDASARLATRLSAHRSALHDRQTGLASLLDGPGKGAPPFSHRFVDKLLVEASRLAAEILELAELADDRSRKSRQAARSNQGMRALADSSFDVILQLDAARHALAASLEGDVGHQRRQRQDAMQTAQGALAELEQQLTQTLAN